MTLNGITKIILFFGNFSHMINKKNSYNTAWVVK